MEEDMVSSPDRQTVRTSGATDGPRIVRIFLALEIPGAVRGAMGDAQRSLRRRGDLPAQWTHTDDAHLTLLFFGNVVATHLPGIIAAMTPVAACHAPFLLRLSGIGAFPSLEAPRVVWLGIAGELDALTALQSDMAAVMAGVTGVVADRKAFRPHLTLARIDARRDRPGVSAMVEALAHPLAVPPLAWDVARVVLMRTMPGGGHRRRAVYSTARLSARGAALRSTVVAYYPAYRHYLA